ncbi:MAG: folate hydrolase, partial [Ferruginibacter sp.]
MKHTSFLLLIFTFILTTSYAQNTSILGFGKTPADAQFAIEKKFDANLSASNVGVYIKEMSAVPHHVGSPGGKATAEYILGKFKSWGYEAV